MSQKTTVPASADASGSTKKVKRVAICFNFVRELAEYTLDPTTKKPVKGLIKTVKGNLIAYITDNIRDHYKIAVLAAAAAATGSTTGKNPQLIEVQPVSYERALTVDGTTKITISRGGYKYYKQSRAKTKRGKAVKIPLGDDRKTAKGNQRYFHFSFPEWFTVPMIMQAISTMLKDASNDRKPLTFKMAASGATYPIPYGMTMNDVPQGWDNAAWLSTTLQTEQNITNRDKITGKDITVSSAGDLNG
jgi:hypothetical protein